jgi:hypothetical protein
MSRQSARGVSTPRGERRAVVEREEEKVARNLFQRISQPAWLRDLKREAP